MGIHLCCSIPASDARRAALACLQMRWPQLRKVSRWLAQQMPQVSWLAAEASSSLRAASMRRSVTMFLVALCVTHGGGWTGWRQVQALAGHVPLRVLTESLTVFPRAQESGPPELGHRRLYGPHQLLQLPQILRPARLLAALDAPHARRQHAVVEAQACQLGLHLLHAGGDDIRQES